MKKSSQIEISKIWQLFPGCFILIVLDLLILMQLIPGHLTIRYHFHQTFRETQFQSLQQVCFDLNEPIANIG